MNGNGSAPWDIPSNWNWAKLESIAEIVRGGSPRPKGDPRYFGGTIPWIMISDITREKGKFITQTRDTVTEAGSQKSRFLKSGTLILSNSGTVCVPKILKVDGCIHDGFVAFPNLTSEVEQLFLFYLFERIRQRVIQQNRQGVTQVNLNTTIVKNFDVPLPPLNEQKRIVAKIEELFTKLDAGVEALQTAKALLKRYRQSVLQAAVTGKLTEQWREEHKGEIEPASVLLERIKKERRRKWEEAELAKMKAKGKAQKDEKWKSSPNSMDSIRLPTGWEIVPTDALFTFVTSGSRGWARYYSESGPIFLRMGNLDHDTINLDLSNLQRVQPPKGTEGTRTRVEAGDILVSITADVGMIALVPEGVEEAYINQHVSLARPVKSVNHKYLAWFMASQNGGQKQFEVLQRGATKVGLGLDDIRNVHVPLPPLKEQDQIVSEIERAFSVSDAIGFSLSEEERRTNTLRQSILKQAFEGKLVPQDPKDEPAERLLARIQGEREKQGPDCGRSAGRRKGKRAVGGTPRPKERG